MTKATMAVASTSSPEMTALADCHMAASPSFFSVALKMGMKAAVNAPSPSRRRNKLGTMKANWNAPEIAVVPMRAAKHCSRTRPSTRLASVAAPIPPDDFNILDISRRGM